MVAENEYFFLHVKLVLNVLWFKDYYFRSITWYIYWIEGNFVSSHREREKKDRRDRRENEREGQRRTRKLNESE